MDQQLLGDNNNNIFYCICICLRFLSIASVEISSEALKYPCVLIQSDVFDSTDLVNLTLV